MIYSIMVRVPHTSKVFRTNNYFCSEYSKYFANIHKRILSGNFPGNIFWVQRF